MNAFSAVVFTALLIVNYVQVARAKDMRSKYESKRYEIRLRNYYRCMQLRDEQASTYARVTAITALRDAEVNLRCFDCLSPEEQNEVEEVWKPNESFLGKKTRVIYDRIKESLLAAVNIHKESDPKEWDYSWEKAELTHSWKGDWWNVIGIDDSLSIADKTMEVLRRKMRGGGKRPKLGDHFELRLPAVTKHEVGWYRCVKRLHTNDTNDRNGDIIQVANMYFVDAISNITSNVRFFENQNESELIARRMDRSFVELKLQTRGVITNWSDCSRCGPKGGETRRKIKCVLMPLENVTAEELNNGPFSYILLFGEIPCRSSLVPLQLRRTLSAIDDVDEIASCQVKCGKATAERQRIIKEVNQFGRETVVDVLPPGEYTLNERLPPLKKPVERRTIKALEKDPYILSCGFGGGGIHWKIDEVYLSSEALSVVFPTNRIFINADHQLVIKSLSLLDDDSFYSCHTAQGDVIRTFSLTVNQNKQQREIVAYVNFGIKFGAFVLMLIMTLTVVLNTSVQSEEKRREIAMQKFKAAEQRNQPSEEHSGDKSEGENDQNEGEKTAEEGNVPEQEDKA